MEIRPEELAQFRSESGWTQKDLAETLNRVLDMHYTGSQVSQWESGKKNIPGYVQEVISGLMGSPETVAPENGAAEGASTAIPSFRRPDTPPGVPDDVQRIPVPVPAGNALETAAIEMFRGIGQGIELAGTVLGGPKIIQTQSGEMISLVQLDGRTIANDAEKLGTAWAHLAQTNAWVARILTSLTTGGAWVEVIMVTSQTAFQVYNNHAGYNRFLAEQSRAPEPEPVPEQDGQVI